MSTYSDLKGKRVVITGGASGIGQATAQQFINEESRVVVFDADQAALDRVISKIPDLCGTVLVDVSDPDMVKKGFEKVDELMGGIDVLISNAGISYRRPFMQIEYEDWSRVLRVNLDGMFLCAKEAAVRMKPQGSGVVLFTASVNGIEGRQLYADYNASKAGIISLAQTMALELSPWLRVNAVCPGYTLTPMQKAEYTPEMFDATNDRIPMNRHAAPEEIGGFYTFLASEKAAYITGQSLVIDGAITSGPYIKGLEQ